MTNFKDMFLVPELIFYLGSKFPSQSRDSRLRARRRELEVINASASGFSPSSSNNPPLNVSGEALHKVIKKEMDRNTLDMIFKVTSQKQKHKHLPEYFQ